MGYIGRFTASNIVDLESPVSVDGTTIIENGVLKNVGIDGIKLKSSGNSITNSDGTTAVLSESGGAVTFTADAAVIEGSSSGDLVRITQTGSGNALVVEDSTNPDSTPFVVDASGKVGIGTDSPSSLIGNRNGLVQLKASGSAGCSYSLIDDTGSKEFVMSLDSADDFVIQNNTATDVYFYLNGAERMRIDSSGDISFYEDTGTTAKFFWDASAESLGIGTSNPSASLEISGTGDKALKISSTSAAYTTRLSLSSGGSGSAVIENTSGGQITFYQGASERMRITSSGQVRIYKESLNVATSSLSVSDLNDFALWIGVNGGNNVTNNIFNGIRLGEGYSGIYGYDAGGSAATGLGFFTGNNIGVAQRMRIDSSGAVYMPDVYSDIVSSSVRDLHISSSGQLGYSTSVRESKTNIEDLPSIDWLYQLNPVKFQYRLKDEDENYTDEADPEIQYGLIAEDVAEINPDLVFGDETENGFELRGIQYSRLFAPMIKAIQEQQTLIESQQSQIDALTTKTQEQDLTIASLISRIEALETQP